eukprot:TRINITY_DN46998_c0_g1_i1.p1 TRINITY_DN46998_c0_g1~~TRINITY_DN46998_c0_g1_i1.p1  ORF type:complete len:304 (+),score=68.34 TRINITY_DN46998_c0_g1_i1:194-1105(+)
METIAGSESAGAPKRANEAWSRFTPSDVKRDRCLARTWGGGRGGQCGRHPMRNNVVCNYHGTHGAAHGLVIGGIPECKLKEFMRHAAASSALSSASGTALVAVDSDLASSQGDAKASAGAIVLSVPATPLSGSLCAQAARERAGNLGELATPSKRPPPRARTLRPAVSSTKTTLKRPRPKALPGSARPATKDAHESTGSMSVGDEAATLAEAGPEEPVCVKRARRLQSQLDALPWEAVLECLAAVVGQAVVDELEQDDGDISLDLRRMPPELREPFIDLVDWASQCAARAADAVPAENSMLEA